MQLRQSPDGSYFAPKRGKPPPCPEGFVRDMVDSFRFYRVSGLGDTLQRAIGKLAFGAKPCAGCKKRQEWLNNKIPYKWTLTSEESVILYQALYDDENLNYGDSQHDRCPGTRFYSSYADWLIGPIIDLGCGRGHTVDHLIKSGFAATGIDQIECNPDMLIGDITEDMNLGAWETSICIDVFEHLYDDQVAGVLKNMQQTQRQVISVCNRATTEKGFGVNLHVNMKTMKEWLEYLEQFVTVTDEIIMDPGRNLFLCERKV